MKTRYAFNLFGLLGMFSLILAGCGAPEQTTLAENAFELTILRQNWWDLELGYDPDPAQAILGDADTSNSLFVVRMEQIENYDWNTQTITLTKKATNDLFLALAAQGQGGDEDLQKLKDLKRSLGYGNALENELYIHGFVVKTSGQTKYGGIFLDAVSQMAINYPVIRVTESNGRAALTFLPIHIPFLMIDPIGADGTIRDAPVVSQAQADVAQLDHFDDWTLGLAALETAVHFRALIHDEAIKEVFMEAGKLK